MYESIAGQLSLHKGSHWHVVEKLRKLCMAEQTMLIKYASLSMEVTDTDQGHEISDHVLKSAIEMGKQFLFLLVQQGIPHQIILIMIIHLS